MFYHTRSMAHVVPKEVMARTLPARRVQSQVPVRSAAKLRSAALLPVPSLLKVLSDDLGIVGAAIRAAIKKNRPGVFLRESAEARWAKNVLLQEWAVNQRRINCGWYHHPASAKAMQDHLLQTIDSLNELYGRE